MTKLNTLQGHKDGSIYTDQCDIPHQQKRPKPHDDLNRCRKSIGQNSTSIHAKNSYQSGYRGNIPQHNKVHI